MRGVNWVSGRCEAIYISCLGRAAHPMEVVVGGGFSLGCEVMTYGRT